MKLRNIAEMVHQGSAKKQVNKESAMGQFEPVRTHLLACSVCLLCYLLILVLPSYTAEHPHSTDLQSAKKSSVEGLLRDITCPLQNRETTAAEFNLQCALKCARAGAPLGILTREGDIYVIVSNSVPDRDIHRKLMPYVGKQVRAAGTVYERNGTKGISIASLEVLPQRAH